MRTNGNRKGAPASIPPHVRGLSHDWLPMQVLLATRANDPYMNPVPIIDQSTG